MEPPNLLAAKALEGQPGYLTSEAFLRYYGIRRGSLEAYTFASVDFVALAQRFGPMGVGPISGPSSSSKEHRLVKNAPWCWTAAIPGPTPGSRF